MSDNQQPNAAGGADEATAKLLAEGRRHHQAGEFHAAEDKYREVLAGDPAQADANHLLGLIAHQTGHHAAGATLIRRAIEANPDDPAFHSNLAIVLNAAGIFAEAEAACRRALAFDATDINLHNLLARALVRQQKYAEAEAVFADLLAATPNDPPILNNFASFLIEAGRVEDAIRPLEHAIALDPQFAMAYANLGAARRQLGQLVQGEQACHRSISLDPAYAPAHNNLGGILLERGDLAAAETALARALELNPGDADALANMGTLHAQQGRTAAAPEVLGRALEIEPGQAAVHNTIARTLLEAGRLDEAMAEFRRTIALDPGFVDAYYNLANAVDNGFDAETIEHLERLLEAGDTEDADRVFLHFAVATTHRRDGRSGDAYRHFEAGNRLRRAHLAAAGEIYDRMAEEDLASAHRRIFTPGYISKHRAAASTSTLPVYVVGVPRSGTTLVEQILAAHPGAHGGGEMTLIPALVHQIRDAGEGRRYPECIEGLDGERLAEFGRAYLDRLAAAGGGADRVVDKSLFNERHLGLIVTLFPNAKIIYCRRDRRDTGLSCYFQNFTDPLPWSTDLDEIGHYIQDYEKMMSHWINVLPVPIHEVSYEQLVADPAPVIRGLIDFVELPWDDRCLRFDQADSVVFTASKWQVRQPIYNQSVGQWKDYASWIEPLLTALDDGG